MDRSPRQSKVRGGARQALTVVIFGVTLALGITAAGRFRTAWLHPRIAVASAPIDDEVYTGSILYTPRDGKICRQILFNNRTGRFTDNGMVDCERASYQGEGGAPKKWSSARLRVISKGFRER